MRYGRTRQISPNGNDMCYILAQHDFGCARRWD